VGKHHIHAVLGEQHAHRPLARQLLRERHQRQALRRGHAGRGLIHQQQPGRVGQRHGQLHPLHVAIGQRTAGAQRLRRHAHLIEQRQRIGTPVVLRARPERKQAPVRRQQGHLHVFHHGERGKGFSDLKGAPHALLPDGARRQAGNVHPGQLDGARIGPQLAAHHVEGGGLARAVGPDQRQHLAGRQRKIHAIDRQHTAKGLAQASHLQQWWRCAHGALLRACQRRARSRANPASPCGNSSTSASMVPPSTARQ
jgi:hypothetical protein